MSTRRGRAVACPPVRLELGPLPSACVIAWIEDVNAVLEDVESGRTNFPFVVTPESIATTRRLLLSCYMRCDDVVFHWSTMHVDPDVAVVQLHYWLTLARAYLDLVERGAANPMRPEAEAFADALLRALLDGLVEAERLDAERAERTWDAWPRNRQLDRSASKNR